MAIVESEYLDPIKEQLINIQDFEVNKLERKELGIDFNFEEAVKPANEIIEFYQQLTVESLDYLPRSLLDLINSACIVTLEIFNSILEFRAKDANAISLRNDFIAKIKSNYNRTFNDLYPLISYSTSRSADFKVLEREARNTIKIIEEESKMVTEQLEKDKDEAEKILGEIRKTAAEHGVSQQAEYFRALAEEHKVEADEWMKKTIWVAIAVGIYALLSILIHKIGWLKPDKLYETIQLGISKILIFAVLTFMLYLFAKNYLSNKHNAIVNRHRQSALQTYRALVDGAENLPNKDVVLNHAAACIFGPQPTGYATDGSGNAPSSKSVVDIISKPIMGAND